MTREEYNANPNVCLNCGKPIYCEVGKVLSEIKKKKFCNHSCSASYNNSHREKKEYFCTKCGKSIGFGYDIHRRTLCDECNPNNVDWDKITYGEVKAKRGYQVNSRIRELARTKYFNTYNNPSCKFCGYDKHVEIHHIKGISTFSDDTPISVINDLSNLIAVCPNHHWELENGYISI